MRLSQRLDRKGVTLSYTVQFISRAEPGGRTISEGMAENIVGPSLASVFEVVYYPRTILVGPDGVIVAIDEQLRVRKLVQTLEKYLGGTPDGTAGQR